MTRGRLLMASFGAPYAWGGATFFYQLSELLRQTGWEVLHFVLATSKEAYEAEAIFGPGWFDPEGFKSRVIVADDEAEIQASLSSTCARVEPELVLSKEARGTVLLRNCFPNRQLLYIRSGDDAARAAASLGFEAADLLNSLRQGGGDGSGLVRGFKTALEETALKTADVIVPQSNLIRDLLLARYPEHLHKTEATLWTCFLMKPAQAVCPLFLERSRDILFVASDWQDPSKNFPWVERISHVLGADLKIRVIGKPPHQGIQSEVLCIGSTKRTDVAAYMRETKLFISPSLFDAAPNSIIEAIYCGCNVLMSRNCGQAELFPGHVVEDLEKIDACAARIRETLHQPKPATLPHTPGYILQQLSEVLDRRIQTIRQKGPLPI